MKQVTTQLAKFTRSGFPFSLTHTPRKVSRDLVWCLATSSFVFLEPGKREHSCQNVQTSNSSLQSVSEIRKRSPMTKNTPWYKRLACSGVHLQTNLTKRILSPLGLECKAYITPHHASTRTVNKSKASVTAQGIEISTHPFDNALCNHSSKLVPNHSSPRANKSRRFLHGVKYTNRTYI